jgi:fibronectin type 3 domain-containing protein
MQLIWSEYCGEVGVDHYVIYRSTAAYTRSDSLAGTTDTTYLDAGAVGDVNTNYFYTVAVIDTAGTKLGDSNQVGEFDRNLIGGLK